MSTGLSFVDHLTHHTNRDLLHEKHPVCSIEMAKNLRLSGNNKYHLL